MSILISFMMFYHQTNCVFGLVQSGNKTLFSASEVHLKYILRNMTIVSCWQELSCQVFLALIRYFGLRLLQNNCLRTGKPKKKSWKLCADCDLERYYSDYPHLKIRINSQTKNVLRYLLSNIRNDWMKKKTISIFSTSTISSQKLRTS